MQPTPQDRQRLGAAGAATGLGCSIAVTIVVFIGGGVLIDRATDSSPVFTLIGVVLGLAGAGYQLYELSRVGRSDVRPGPLTRQIGRVAGRRGSTTDPRSNRENEE